jgi:hypothetical protein
MPEEQPPSISADGAHFEEEIARLAYRYYEEEGRPEGRAEEHWRRAQEEFHGPVPPWTAESGAGDA